MSKLNRLNYIKIGYVNNNRRIYLNSKKIPIKVSNNCNGRVEDNCYHNINNKNKNNYNKTNIFKQEESMPYWMEHPEVCRLNPMTDEEIKELEKEISLIQKTTENSN